MADTEAWSVDNTLHLLRRLRFRDVGHPVVCRGLEEALVDDHGDGNQDGHDDAYANVEDQVDGSGKDKGVVSDPTGFSR